VGQFLAFAFLLSLVAGCGTQEKAYPVEGIVKFKGDPPDQAAKELAGASIAFTTLDAKESATGSIGADGKFTLATNANRASEIQKGAVARKYKVTISNGYPLKERRADQKYEGFTTTPLEAEVKPGVPNQFEFVIDWKSGARQVEETP